MSYPKYEASSSWTVVAWYGDGQYQTFNRFEAACELNRLAPDASRLDWWFECNEKERGHVMALVHMQGMSKRDAIDKVMSATKGAK